jgi:nicotinate phosphoribosyltransferase
MARRGQKLLGVRLDSGDMAGLSVEVRRILDSAGLTHVKIIGSGGLDEFEIAELSAANARFDSYGVGTKMGVSSDQPWTDIAYKLAEYDNRPVLKLSTGKSSWPGRKQVFRVKDKHGQLERDTIGLRHEELPGERLLKEVMRGGKMTAPYPTLAELRDVFAGEFAALPESVKTLRRPSRFPVEFSAKLKTLRDETAENSGRAR